MAALSLAAYIESSFSYYVRTLDSDFEGRPVDDMSSTPMGNSPDVFISYQLDGVVSSFPGACHYFVCHFFRFIAIIHVPSTFFYLTLFLAPP